MNQDNLPPNTPYIESKIETSLSTGVKLFLLNFGVVIQEPLASLSSLIICLIYLYLCISNVDTIILSIMYILIAVNSFGSFYLHSIFTNYAIIMDAFTMHSVLLVMNMILISLINFPIYFVISIITTLFIGSSLLYRWNRFLIFDQVEMILIFGISNVIFLGLNILYQTYDQNTYYWLIKCFGIFILALILQIFSRYSPNQTNPTSFQNAVSIIEPHTLWHILVGIDLYLLINKVTIPLMELSNFGEQISLIDNIIISFETFDMFGILYLVSMLISVFLSILSIWNLLSTFKDFTDEKY